jgi:hypothetical protein
VDADLDTLATALYVRTDDLLKAAPERVPSRPTIGIAPRISDAELITLAVLQALLRFTSEARWLRYARAHLRHLFRYLPQQPGYNKRLRRLAPTIEWLIGVLARDTSLWTDDVWVVDSTPVECARSRETVHRSELAGWAEYGYCASHSRYFWGLRLHLIATLHGLPVGFALTVWGSRTSRTPLSSGDRRPSVVGHDRRRVAAAAVSALPAGAEADLAAGPPVVHQRHRTARAAARGRRAPPHQPKTTPGLGRSGRVRRPRPAATPSTAPPSPADWCLICGFRLRVRTR